MTYHKRSVTYFLSYVDKANKFLPEFKILPRGTGYIWNRVCESNSDLCIKVSISDRTGMDNFGYNDFISLKYSSGSKTVLKGKYGSNGKKVVVMLADENNPEDKVN